MIGQIQQKTDSLKNVLGLIAFSVVVLPFLGFSQFAFSSPNSWEQIALDLSQEGSLRYVFFDSNSYQNLGNGKYRAITKWLYRLNDFKLVSETNYQIDLSEYDCNSKTINILSMASHNRLNNVLEDFRPEQSIPVEIAKGSNNEQILEFICQKNIESEAIKKCRLEKENYLKTKKLKEEFKEDKAKNKTIAMKADDSNFNSNFDLAEESLKQCLYKQNVRNFNLIDSLK